jgi:TrpR-related protein YerC/YecD
MSDLFAAILDLEDADEVERFLRDLCTLSELQAMAHRWEVAKLVEQGLPYQEISSRRCTCASKRRGCCSPAEFSSR